MAAPASGNEREDAVLNEGTQLQEYGGQAGAGIGGGPSVLGGWWTTFFGPSSRSGGKQLRPTDRDALAGKRGFALIKLEILSRR